MRACELREKGALFESKSMESTNARARESGWTGEESCTRLEWLGARFNNNKCNGLKKKQKAK
jgi:hypothetical protein